MSMSTVRKNLLAVEGYTPYCGNGTGSCSMPRTKFNGEQFVCKECKWVSIFPTDFIYKYKKLWSIK